MGADNEVPVPAEPAVPTAALPRRRWRLAVALPAALLSAAAAGLVALAALIGWSVGSSPGTAWLVAHLPGVRITTASGTLLGDFAAQRVELVLPGSAGTLVLDGVAWRGLRLARSPGHAFGGIVVDDLRAARVDVQLTPNPAPTLRIAPTDLRLPMEIDIRSLQVGELHIASAGAPPSAGVLLRNLSAQLHLGAAGGAEHRVGRLSIEWDQLKASGHAVIATTGQLNADAVLDVVQATGSAWAAHATLAGPLAAPAVRATVRAQPNGARPAQALDARATLRPFAPWPIDTLQASTQALDLAAFSSSAPITALSGTAVATRATASAPVVLTLDISNKAAGRWNEGRLPLRSAKLELAALPDHAADITLTGLLAELGNAQAAAGRVQGHGEWRGGRWTLATTVAALQPAQLDARAPAMQLAGTLGWAGGDFTTPDASVVELRAELDGSVTTATTKSATAATAKPRTTATQPVRLRLNASLQAQRIELREGHAAAGAARAELSGLATRAAGGATGKAPWLVKAQGSLAEFDPAVWWPGRDDSPWRKAPTRINATLEADLALPTDTTPSTPLTPLTPPPTAAEWLAAVRGQASAVLAPSLLAGVPVSGKANVASDGSGARPTLQLDAAGNSLRAQGIVAAGSSGQGDRWELTLDAPALARLAPAFALFLPPGSEAALAGALKANANISGRWPRITTQGTLEANALRVGGTALQKAEGRWQLGSGSGDAMEAQLTLTQLSALRAGVMRPWAETAQVQLQGTGRAHQLTARVESKALPPVWAEALQASGTAPASPTAADRSAATLQAQGGFVEAAASGLAGWRGSVQELAVRTTHATAPLLLTRDVGIDLRWGGAASGASATTSSSAPTNAPNSAPVSAPVSATVQPGHAEVLGGTLRWSRIAWQAARTPGGAAQIDAQAELEPMRVVPLLARAQPDFGWGGDLTVAGKLVLRSAPTFSADIVIERRSGDLTVKDDLSTQALGLTDLRLGLVAENGVWNFTQAIAGTSLGVGVGAVVARTSAEATWPAADTPIEGVFELRVAKLGSWGTWVPPGWRLDGALHASASIGGRVRAPEYTGEIEGTGLAVRNFVQGVNVTDGDLAIHLRGTTARIERFTAKAGGGTVRLSGDASLGEAPKAVLSVVTDKFQLLGRVDRRIVASGQAQLQLDAKTLALTGQFGVDEGLIDFTRSDAPSLADDVDVVRATPRPAFPGGTGGAGGAGGTAPPTTVAATAAPNATPSAANPTAREVALDLRVALGEQLRLRGRGLDTGLRGELRITSPGGRLAVNGTVSTADGTYAAYGQKLSIDRGLVTFNGAVNSPRLDIEATRPNTDVRVGVAITGSTLNPRIRLFSEPELSEIDKLSWLVMGRASDGLGRSDTALLQRAAVALLAGDGKAPTDAIFNALGIDDFSVRQSDGDTRDTIVSLGKQLSRRWYVGYERGVNATAGTWQLIYRIAQRFTLRAQSGNENAVDLIWQWRW